MFPTDSRLIAKLSAASLTEEELRTFIDGRNAFMALEDEHTKKMGLVKEKEMEYRDIYLRSNMFRQDFDS
jgi:hypothetical protein